MFLKFVGSQNIKGHTSHFFDTLVFCDHEFQDNRGYVYVDHFDITIMHHLL